MVLHCSLSDSMKVSSAEQSQVSDLWLTLFWAALVSPKRSAVRRPLLNGDSCCRYASPIQPSFARQMAKRISSAQYVLECDTCSPMQEHTMGQIPPLSRLSRTKDFFFVRIYSSILAEQASSLPSLSLRLIAWLQETKKVKLRSIPVAEVPKKQNNLGISGLGYRSFRSAPLFQATTIRTSCLRLLTRPPPR